MIFAKLFILTYAFLLRMPSEALPGTKGGDGSQSCLTVQGDKLVIASVCDAAHLSLCSCLRGTEAG